MSSANSTLTIEHLVKSWPRRAAVIRHPNPKSLWDQLPLVADRPDYPENLLPFSKHPGYLGLPEETKCQILSWAWLAYNQRVITAEECVVNPSLGLVTQGKLPIENQTLRQAIHQTLLDENYHSWMHYIAMQETRAFRNITARLPLPNSVTYRRLLTAQEQCHEPWQKSLLGLIWSAVAEVSINALLSLLSTDQTIQPAHRKIVALHNADEYAHSSYVVDLMKELFITFSTQQKAFFIQWLPYALNAFVEQDYLIWEVILPHLNCPNAVEILTDVRAERKSETLVRDFSGLRDLSLELEIVKELEFVFSDQNCGPIGLGDLDLKSYE